MAQACDKYSKTALMGKGIVLNQKEIGTKKDFIQPSHLEKSYNKKRYFMTITKIGQGASGRNRFRER
jgi:hypothetical protein